MFRSAVVKSYDCEEVAVQVPGAQQCPAPRCQQRRRDDRRPPGSSTRQYQPASPAQPDTTSEKFLSSAGSQAILQLAGTEIQSLTEQKSTKNTTNIS